MILISNRFVRFFSLNLISLILIIFTVNGQRPMEFLDRGLVALETNNGIFLSWRMLGTDSLNVGFNLYRNGDKINENPITESTNYIDASGVVSSRYQVETIKENGDNQLSANVSVWPLHEPESSPGKSWVPLKRIVLPNPPVKEGVEFIPGEMSVGDLDGDGDYELIFEWEASIGIGSFLEAIDLDGKSLWRVSAGVNVTTAKLNFMVYDLNMDGKAEVTFLSGPGTIDGSGNYINRGPAANYDPEMEIPRPSGRLMDDPQFITLLDGETGVEMATIEHWPPIGPRKDMLSVWGDDYGHRASSLKGAVLYTEENGPLVVFQRGVYTRVGVGAYKWDGAHELSTVWNFDSYDSGNEDWTAQGNHTVSVGDLDNDGNDELIIGAAAIDHDGTGLWSTKKGHGDANHLGDHIPDRPGLEFFMPHENGIDGISMIDAATGEIIWNIPASYDVGRAWADDVDPNHRGSEVVPVGYPNYDCNGNQLSTGYDAYHQPVYFDGEVQRGWRKEWSTNSYKNGRILTGWYYGASNIHGSKKDVNLVADILGDWREELIMKHANNRELLLFSTWITTKRKNYTLMHDPTYRMTVAVQNVGYNQPAHVGYYFADGAPKPDIYLVERDVSAMSYGNFYMQPVHSLLAVDTSGSVSQQEYTGSADQVWQFKREGDAFEIYSYQANLYLGYQSAVLGSEIVLTNAASKRKFKVVKVPDTQEYYLLSEDNDSLVVTVNDSSMNVDANLILTKLSKSGNKKFMLINAGNELDCNNNWGGSAYKDNCDICVSGKTDKYPNSEDIKAGYYKISTSESDLCLEFGNNVHTANWNGKAEQMWEILSNGTFYTVNETLSGEFLKYRNGSLTLVSDFTESSQFRLEELIGEGNDTSYVITTVGSDTILGFKDNIQNLDSELTLLSRDESGNQRFYLERLTVDKSDCHEDWNGSAYVDDCGRCAGGNTGIEPCAEFTEEYYKIKPKHSNLCLDLKQEYPTQENCNDEHSQIWMLDRQTDGSYKVKNKETGKFLFLAETTRGANFSSSTDNSTDFIITESLAGANSYYINPVTNDVMYADVSGGRKNPGTQILLWTYSGDDNQKYLIQPIAITSIDNNIKGENVVRIYPNPVIDNVHMVLNQQSIVNAKYEIYDISGSLVKSNTISENITNIQMKDMRSGLYLIRVFNGNEIFNIKINKL